jgi:hypothetical protein
MIARRACVKRPPYCEPLNGEAIQKYSGEKGLNNGENAGLPRVFIFAPP